MVVKVRFVFQDKLGDDWINRVTQVRTFDEFDAEDVNRAVHLYVEGMEKQGWFVVSTEIVGEKQHVPE